MATRTSSPSGSRSTTSRSGTSRRQTRRPTSTSRSKSSRSRSRSSSRRDGPGPLTRLLTAFGRGMRAVWLGVAHLLGGLVRAVGSTARDLDPEHRRDGLGLSLIGAAVVVGAAEWWRLPGSVGHGVRAAVEGTVGIAAYAMPLLLLGFAYKTLRRPSEDVPMGRPVIGWTAITLGVLGLIHIQHGLPRPRGDAGGYEGMREAGGSIGYVSSAVLTDLFRTTAIAVPLLALLTAFGF